MMGYTTSVTYTSSDPGSAWEMTVETDEDLGEVLFQAEEYSICIDPQQAAQIVRQLTSWLGTRAARTR